MKNGKHPTREQRKLIEFYGLDAHDWFVCKDTPTEMQIVHRNNDKTMRTIKKG
jgi:hypothetical protein